MKRVCEIDSPRVIFLLSLLFLLTAGCEHIIPDDPPEPEPPPPFDGSLYMPLTPGNYWELENASSGKSLRFTIGDKLVVEGRTYTWRYIEERDRYNDVTSQEAQLICFRKDTLYQAVYSGTPDSLVILGKKAIMPLNPYAIGEDFPTSLPGISSSAGEAWWEVFDAGLTLLAEDSQWRDVIQMNLQFLDASSLLRYLVRAEFYSKHLGPVRIFRKPFVNRPGDRPDITEVYDLVEWRVQQNQTSTHE